MLHASTADKPASVIVYRKRGVTSEPAAANVILEWDAFARDGLLIRP
jgi:hypothetical protein